MARGLRGRVVNASTDVVLWLESPEGESWSRSRHAPINDLMTVKYWDSNVFDYIWLADPGDGLKWWEDAS